MTIFPLPPLTPPLDSVTCPSLPREGIISILNYDIWQEKYTIIKQIICMLYHTTIGQKPLKVLNKVGILNIRYGPHKTVWKHVYAHF